MRRYLTGLDTSVFRLVMGRRKITLEEEEAYAELAEAAAKLRTAQANAIEEERLRRQSESTQTAEAAS